MNEFNHNHQKKIAVINDLSGFGRCSLTVSLPVISHLKLQCCPIPTAILSNHTGYPSYFIDDYTRNLSHFSKQFKQLGLKFDGIATGYLGSKEQVAMICDFVKEFHNPNTILLVDPVMGDHGELYTGYSKDLCEELKKLVALADIITPNITEACLLTNTSYKDTSWKQPELLQLAFELSNLGPRKVVISGIDFGSYVGNFVYEKNDAHAEFKLLKNQKVGTPRAGTGDLFASILIADAVNQVPLCTSVRKASKFIKNCILESEKLEIPPMDGVCFEQLLNKLK